MGGFSIRRCVMLLGICSIPSFALLGLFAGDGNDRVVLLMSLIWITPLLAVLKLLKTDPRWVVLPSSLVATLPIVYAVSWLFQPNSARDMSTAHLAPLFLFIFSFVSLVSALCIVMVFRGLRCLRKVAA